MKSKQSCVGYIKKDYDVLWLTGKARRCFNKGEIYDIMVTQECYYLHLDANHRIKLSIKFLVVRTKIVMANGFFS